MNPESQAEIWQADTKSGDNFGWRERDVPQADSASFAGHKPMKQRSLCTLPAPGWGSRQEVCPSVTCGQGGTSCRAHPHRLPRLLWVAPCTLPPTPFGIGKPEQDREGADAESGVPRNQNLQSLVADELHIKARGYGRANNREGKCLSAGSRKQAGWWFVGSDWT